LTYNYLSATGGIGLNPVLDPERVLNMPHFRIAWLMAVVAIAALNFGAVRAGLKVRNQLSTPIIDLLNAGALPMANVLAIGLLVGGQRRGSRSFLLGFEAFGATALALYIAVSSLYANKLVIPYLLVFLSPLARAVGEPRSVVLILVFIALAVVVLGLPQLVFALLGGLLCRKFKNAERPIRTRD
jgi:hypothetical protein